MKGAISNTQNLLVSLKDYSIAWVRRWGQKNNTSRKFYKTAFCCLLLTFQRHGSSANNIKYKKTLAWSATVKSWWVYKGAAARTLDLERLTSWPSAEEGNHISSSAHVFKKASYSYAHLLILLQYPDWGKTDVWKISHRAFSKTNLPTQNHTQKNLTPLSPPS